MGTRRSWSGGILGWEKSKSGGGGGGVDYDEDEQQQEEEEEECDVGLGLGMQLNDATPSSSSSSVFPSRKAAPAHHPQSHPYYHYLSGDHVGGGSAYGGNLTSNLLLNQGSYMGLGGPREATPFFRSPDCFPSGGKMEGASGVPFTAAQWQELERQNTILKYMMASVPVPSELLLPISSTPKSYSNVILPSRAGGDPEPWRCRRTDGKKWRCSRDVAPHQKYCERHSHKNRPRSRKLVELPSAAAAAAADYLLNPAAKSTTKRSVASQPQQQHQQPPLVDSRQALSSHFITTFDQDTPACFASSQPFDQPRCLDWFMKGETIPNLDWHPHQHQNDAAVFHRNDSNSSSSDIDLFRPKQASQYSAAIPQDCGLLLMEGIVDPSHGQQTRRFIDAWSDVDDGGGNRATSSYNPSPGKDFDPPTSSLSLTMCGGEGEDYSLGNHRMGEKPHWMSGAMGHQGSWMGSPPGGPLAEALCLGSIGEGTGCVRYRSSPRGCSSITTTTTTNTTSSRSSSKDEGQEELNFIG